MSNSREMRRLNQTDPLPKKPPPYLLFALKALAKGLKKSIQTNRRIKPELSHPPDFRDSEIRIAEIALNLDRLGLHIEQSLFALQKTHQPRLQDKGILF